MVFSLQSEKCVKAVEGHTYYNKTKETNNRASILKSSDIQHIIVLVISVRIRRVAEGRRHLNPAAPFSMHNERDAGVLLPRPVLPLCHRHTVVPRKDASLPANHGGKCSVCGYLQWCPSFCSEKLCSIGPEGLNSAAHLLPSQALGTAAPGSCLNKYNCKNVLTWGLRPKSNSEKQSDSSGKDTALSSTPGNKAPGTMT